MFLQIETYRNTKLKLANHPQLDTQKPSKSMPQIISPDNTVLMKGLKSNFSVAADIRYQHFGQTLQSYSLVAFGKCNFRCSFCFACGSSVLEDGTLPDAELMSIEEIDRFIIEEIRAGRIIRFSGGEPTLFVNELTHFLKTVRRHNGCSIVDTNGSQPEALRHIAMEADIISIDPFKANIDSVEQITGISKEYCWDAPLRSMEELSKCDTSIELKTVLFSPIDLDLLKKTIEILPPKAHWTLKQYLPTRSRFSGKNSDIQREKQINDLTPAQPEEMLAVQKQLIQKHSDLKGRLTVVIGSARNPSNYHLA